MWQYQKLSMLLGFGLIAIATSTGCATTVEDPVVDEQAMSEEDAAESSEALTVGGGYGDFGYGRFYGRGLYGHGWRGLGRYPGYYRGYGDCDYGCGGYYPDYRERDINIYVEQNNGYGGYPDYDLGDDYYGDDYYGDDYFDDYGCD